jgi:hypothetical protein
MRRGIVDDGYGRIASAVVKPSLEKKALMEDEYAQDLAEKLVGNWQKFESFGWGSQPEENPENWTIVYTSNRDSGLTDQANAAAIEEIMGQFPEDQVVAESHGHWAVGHVDGYSIRVYEPDGTLTPAFKAWAEIQLRLKNYPILDENRLSEMEFEAAVENCEYAVPSRLNSYPNERVQEHWDTVMDSDTAAANFMDWAKDNDPHDMQSDDDHGYYPDDSIIDEWIEEVIVPQMPPPEPGDEDYEEPDPGAEGFATGPNPVDPRQTSLPFKGGRRRAQWVDMGNGHWVNEDTGEHEYEETEEEPSKEPASFEGYGRGKNPDPLRQRLPLGTPAPRLPPGFEGFSEEEMSGRGARRRAQAAPQLPSDEEELNPDEMEEMAPTPEQQGLEKFNWNDYVWGPFRKKPGLRLRAQMSTQDDAIVRMVEQEDARLVKYRGGLALVPIDGYAYPVDQAGAELALAHGAEDYTQPKQRAGAREAGMYKGVPDEGLARIARIFKAQSADTGNEILDAMARAIFVSSWANEWENLFQDYDRKFLQEAGAAADIEVPNFQGAELMDLAPPTEPEAYQVAQKMYDAIEQANGIDLATFLPPGQSEDDYFDRSDFGHYLAMQVMGTGVRWSDSHPDHGLKMPYMEGYVSVDETDRLKNFIMESYEFDNEDEEEPVL